MAAQKTSSDPQQRIGLHPLFAPIVSESAESNYRTLDVPERVVPLFGRKPPRLWYLGNPSLLNRPLVGILSGRAAESSLNPNTTELLAQLAGSQIAFVGGWHSPLEKESLKVLLSETPLTIICLAKSVDRFAFFQDLKTLLNQDRLLLLTHCSPRARRISRDAAIKRNHLVAGLARVLLVLAAPEGGATFKLAQSVIEMRRPVFVVEHPSNERLLACGALPASFAGIQRLLQP